MRLYKLFTIFFIIISVFIGCAKKDESGTVVISGSQVSSVPSKPTGLTALTGVRKGEIKLSWTANSESDFLGYNIYGASQGGGEFAFVASQSVNYYTVTDLIPGFGYFFRITALDNENNQSEPSSEVFAVAKGDNIAPAMPLGLTALAGSISGQVNLSWTANEEPDLSKYVVYQSNTGTSYSLIDEIIGQPPGTTYVVDGLTSSTYSYFKISAVDDSDNESDLGIRVGITVP